MSNEQVQAVTPEQAPSNVVEMTPGRRLVVDLNRIPAREGFKLLKTWNGKGADGQTETDVEQMLPMVEMAIQPEYREGLGFLEAFAALQVLTGQLGTITQGMNIGGN